MDGLQDGILRLAYQFVPFLIAVVGHEFGHAFVAHLWGDDSAKNSGRLTLNPAPHIDVLGTLVFPILSMVSGVSVMFGWAIPVPIDPSKFRKFRPGLFSVALGGPGANVIMAFGFAFALAALQRFASPEFFFFKEFSIMFEFAVYINYGLALFNLIPLPPLDGSKVIQSFLSPRAMFKYEQLSRVSAFILLALILTGVIRFIGVPVMFAAQWTLDFGFRIFSAAGGSL